MNKTALHILGVVAVAALTSACGSGAPQSDYHPNDETDEGGSDAGGGSDAAGGSDGGLEEQGGQGGQGNVGNQGGEGGEPPDTDCAPGGQMSCYDGDPTTIGVGNCKEGISTCEPNGFWGSCTDQVLPALAEDCNIIGDEDCDGAVCSDPVWYTQLQATGSSWILDMTVAPDGSIYLAGQVAGSVTLDGQTLTALNSTGNALVVKLDASGAVVWKRLSAYSARSAARALTLDPQGNLLVVGSFAPGFDAGGGVLSHAGDDDMYIARYDATTGNHLASHYITQHTGQLLGQAQSGSKLARDVVVMSNGTIAVVGQYTGHWGCLGLNCAPANPTNDTGSFVRGYNANFGLLWANAINHNGADDMVGAAALPNGWLVAVGDDPNGARFDTYQANGAGNSTVTEPAANAHSVSVMANGDQLIALTKWSNAGDAALRRIGAVNSTWTVAASTFQHLTSAFEDQDGNLVITGYYGGNSFNLGNGILPAPSNNVGAFIAKLTPSYQHIWSKTFAGTGVSFSRSVARHPSGRILFDGTFQSGDIDFGLGLLTKYLSSPREPFIAMFEP